MKIGVLTEEVNNEDVAGALKEAGEKLGAEIVVLDLNEFAVVNFAESKVLYKGKPLDDLDACLIRGSESKLDFRLHIVEYMAKLGIKVINKPEAIEICDNKFDTQTLLNSIGVKTPNTVELVQVEQLDAAVHLLEEKFPMIVKTQSGSHGVGVIKVESYEGLKSIVQYLLAQKTSIMIQEFIPHKESGRIMILGDKVIAAVMRTIPDGDFRSNMDQGAELKKHEASEQETEVALKVAKALGCELSAIDYIMTEDGDMVIFEANSSPGLKGIQSVNDQVNIAEEIMKFVIEHAGNEEDEEETAKKKKDYIAIKVPGMQDAAGMHAAPPATDTTTSTQIDGASADQAASDENAVADSSGTGDEEEEEQSTVGLAEPIVIKRINDGKPFDAKVDTGADRCSLHGENIEIGENYVRFSIGEVKYKVPLERTVTVIQSNGSERRPIVKFDVEFNGNTFDGVEFNVSDRSDMSHQVIVGKNLLELSGALVDPQTK
jgi:ribosomal protein S6--L-glutamate ligase